MKDELSSDGDRESLGAEASLDVRSGLRRTVRQRRVRAGCSASLERPSLRSGCPAMLGRMAPSHNSLRSLRSLRSNKCDESEDDRAARGATRPALLGAPEALRNLPGRAFAETAALLAANTTTVAARQAVPGGGDFCGGEERKFEVGARSAHQHLTRRHCLSAVSKANAASLSTRPRTEHHSAVDAQHRPPQHEPAPGTACRAASNLHASSSKAEHAT